MQKTSSLTTFFLNRSLPLFSCFLKILKRNLLPEDLEEKREYVPFAQLIECLDRQYSNLRYSVYRHIHKIRPRLWQFGLDIVSMREMGYALVHTRLAAPGG